MSGTTYEYGDFDQTLLELMDANGEFAWMLGSDAYHRLVKLVWVLHQAINDETVGGKLDRLYDKGLNLWPGDGLRVLNWICAENKHLNSLSPLERLFDKDVTNEPFDVLGRLEQGVFS